MLWKNARIAVLDTETTGLDETQCRVVELAVVWVEGGRIVGSNKQLLHPEGAIPPEVTAIHGISDAMVAGKPVFGSIAKRFLGASATAIFAAYNADFDRRFMLAEYQRSAKVLPDLIEEGSHHPLFDAWIDPLVWVREEDRFVRGSGKNKLTAACARRDILLNQQEKAHRALADATLAAKLLIHLMPRLPDDLDDLIAKQIRLATEQQANFDAWRAKKTAQGG